jgi:hypothetical protein
LGMGCVSRGHLGPGSVTRQATRPAKASRTLATWMARRLPLLRSHTRRVNATATHEGTTMHIKGALPALAGAACAPPATAHELTFTSGESTTT